MFKIVFIILALIGLVGTTTHYAFANANMGGPAMGPVDSGGGGGGSSSQGPSDTTTSPGAGSGGSSDHWSFPESWSHPRGWEPEPSTQISPWYQHHQQHPPRTGGWMDAHGVWSNHHPHTLLNFDSDLTTHSYSWWRHHHIAEPEDIPHTLLNSDSDLRHYHIEEP